MANHKKKLNKRNSFAKVCRERHPRKQKFKHRADKRTDDAKNHWSREWE